MMLSEVGEKAVISKLLEVISRNYPKNQLPLGDDAAAVRIGYGRWMIVKVDGASAAMSKYTLMSWYDFSWRVAAAAVTDIIAKGGKPVGIAVSVGIPANYDENVVYELVRGVNDLASSVGSYVLGGDLNESVNDVWVDVVAVGTAEKLIPITGLDVDDYLYVTGCVGLSAIPYIMFVKNLDPTPWTDLLKTIWRPKPPTDFLYIVTAVKSATDISDGITSISRMAVMNRLGIAIDSLPLCDECLEFMRENKIDEEEVLRYLGEEYHIVFAVTDAELPGNYRLFGRVVSKEGVFYRGKQINYGWEYFKGFR